MGEILPFPDNRANNEPIIDADYFGYSETIPITDLLTLLQKVQAAEIKDEGGLTIRQVFGILYMLS